MIKRTIAGISLLLALTGCWQAAAWVANVQADLNGQRHIANIAYGADPRQTLDIFLPANPPSHMPAIIFFYGGSWQYGDPASYAFAAEPFTTAGYMVVIPDYAHYPPHRFPAFVEDGALAVKWVQEHAAEYGGDAAQLVLAGHSAGGHIAALLATDARYLQQVGMSRQNIHAFIGLAGPYDFVPEDEDIKAIFEPAGGNASSAMPVTYVDGGQPPMLLLYGLDDETVWPRNHQHMEKAIARQGGQVTVREYEGIGHIGIIAALSRPLRHTAPVVEDMLAYLKNNNLEPH